MSVELHSAPPHITADQTWQADAPLAAEGTWLLEASAGTGKTWQLASLVSRLVIEEGVAIDRVLIITFTRAATAELRDRIRGRLVEARELLRRVAGQPSEAALGVEAVDAAKLDPVLRRLVFGPEAGPTLTTEAQRERLVRVEVALSAFDLAPISTIHGFCQRMLERLAFESGQDADLTLLEDETALHDRIVLDAMATVQATASVQELAQLQELGWRAPVLQQIVRAAAGGSGRHLEPAAAPGADASLVARARRRQIAALHAWWHADDGGRALVAAIRAECAKPAGAKRLNARSYAERFTAKHDAALAALLSAGDFGNKPPSCASYFFASRLREKANAKVSERFAHPGAARLEAEFQALARISPLPAFAAHARQAVAAALQTRHQFSHDAILQRLADAITAEAAPSATSKPERPLATAIRGLYDVALVDEFQDTDGDQWTVLREVFHGKHKKRLFLIGDPKQAIYAFRGADVFVYLSAKAETSRPTQRGEAGRYTMTTNYRSDGRVVAAMNALWRPGSQAFGDLAMDYIGVDTPATTPETRLISATDGQPYDTAVALRWLAARRTDTGLPRRPAGKPAARTAAATSCAMEIGQLLTGPARIVTNGQPRRVRPQDCAVLVNTHREGALIKRALGRLGIQAVAGGKDSVFQSEAARWLLQWLDAVATPSDDATARALAVSPLLPWTLTELAAALAAEDGVSAAAAPVADEGERRPVGWRPLDWTRWRDAIASASARWQRARFSGVMQRFAREYGVFARVLTLQDGERHATDLRHLLELGHAAERQRHLSPAGLADWLRKQRAEAAAGGEGAQLRLESDAEAVQIVTIHKSKGLQYPIVLLPFAWSARQPKNAVGPLVVHPWRDDAEPERRATAVLDLHPPESEERQAHFAFAETEFLEEETRKLYVALTRAQHRCVAWFGSVAEGADRTALNRLLFRSPAARQTLEAACKRNTTRKAERIAAAWAQIDAAAGELLDQAQAMFGPDDGVAVRLETPASRAEQTRMAERLRAARAAAERGGDETVEGEVAQLPAGRHLGSSWQRASYSSMAGRLTQHAPAAAPELPTSAGGAPLDPQPGEDDGELDEVMALGEVSAVGEINAVDELSALGDIDALSDSARDDGQLPAAPHPGAIGGQRPLIQASEQAEAERWPLPLAKLWGGTKVGVWAHAVLELLNFDCAAAPAPTGPALAALTALTEGDGAANGEALQEAAAGVRLWARAEASGVEPALALARRLGAHHGHTRAADHARFVLALPGILSTPLRATQVAEPWRLPAGMCLAHLQQADRLDELAFDLRLAGGEVAIATPEGEGGSARIDVDAAADALALRLEMEPRWDGRGWLAPLLARARGAEQEPAYQRKLRAWAEKPADSRGRAPRPWALLPRIRGILTGLIDLTFRVPAEVPGGYRYYLADYKTNRLTDVGSRETTAAHYTRPWLAWAMGHHAYHLQSLLYTVALHRFLRARLSDYDYDLHCGGHLYLFLRGMIGPDAMTDEGCARGVYHDRWPKAVVEAMDRAFEGPSQVGDDQGERP